MFTKHNFKVIFLVGLFINNLDDFHIKEGLPLSRGYHGLQ